ncbi:hypothetical protein [Rhodoferax sp.]|uniref:hypothetical protein n=1 Tax=Rhodoferax sp. TaxID=50421 RepID=UPI00374D670B
MPLPDGLRVSRVGDWVVACNFSKRALHWSPNAIAKCLLGNADLAPQDVVIWKAEPGR